MNTLDTTPHRQQLADGFDDLVRVERLQDEHRRELARRHQRLAVEQRCCDDLEAHLAERLDLLVREAVLLERSADRLPGCAGSRSDLHPDPQGSRSSLRD